MPTEQIKELLEYNEFTGIFNWKVRRAQMLPGYQAGSCITIKKAKTTKKYRSIRINKKHYYEHRLAWEFLYGPIPKGMQIDHINGNSTDNRIKNLKLVNQSENNIGRITNNKSGITGVYKHKTSPGWTAELTFEGKKLLKAYYPTKAAAGKARAAAYNDLLKKLQS